MNLLESKKLTGEYTIRIENEDGVKKLWQPNSLGKVLGIKLPFITGKYVEEYKEKNLVVDSGLAAIASRINGDGSEDIFTYIAVGDDDTAESASDTSLGSEITGNGLARANASVSRETTNTTNDTAVLEYKFDVTGSESIREVGVFNDASSGTMLSRTVIATKNVSDGDDITITYKVYAE